jgi:hypothetical protein
MPKSLISLKNVLSNAARICPTDFIMNSLRLGYEKVLVLDFLISI